MNSIGKIKKEKIMLAHLPTPIERLARLEEFLGAPTLYIKRDDQTGLATGGNKTRKLEFLLADAIKKGADTVITTGAIQSNSCRQIVAGCNKMGLSCELVLGGDPNDLPSGNLFLDELLGAKIYWTERKNRNKRLQELFEELQKEGRTPYLIPIGGSNEVGALGYFFAMEEIMAQIKQINLDISHILFTTSSGGTQAGLVAGAKEFGFEGKILGIHNDKDEDTPDDPFEERLSVIANKILEGVGSTKRTSRDDFLVDWRYLGGGYEVVREDEKNAVQLMARKEGILIDPVYTSKAIMALVDMVQKGEFKKTDTILFLHTGGTSSLFAYEDVLVK